MSWDLELLLSPTLAKKKKKMVGNMTFLVSTGGDDCQTLIEMSGLDIKQALLVRVHTFFDNKYMFTPYAIEKYTHK